MDVHGFAAKVVDQCADGQQKSMEIVGGCYDANTGLWNDKCCDVHSKPVVLGLELSLAGAGTARHTEYKGCVCS